MSWKYAELKDIEGVRKVKWDERWHIMYKWGNRDTWDRVDKKTAMNALKKIEKAFKENYK